MTGAPPINIFDGTAEELRRAITCSISSMVVVINAEKVKLTGSKESQKTYSHFSGYRSGEYTLTAAAVRARHPERLIESAVHGMLPRNRSLSRAAFKRLKVYAGANHPHTAQNPKVVDLK